MGVVTSTDLDLLGPPEPSNLAPFLLSGNDRLWIIETGKVDLFLVHVEAGEPSGPRYSLLRLEAGKALFDVPATQNFGLLACPAPGSRLGGPFRFPAQLREGQQNLIDDWIGTLSASLSGPIAPKSAKQIAAEQKLKLNEEEPQPVVSHEGIVWVTQEQGTARPFGSTNYDLLAPGLAFPLNRYAWLQVDARSTLRGIDTASWAASEPDWKSLEAFHQFVILAFIVRNREEENREAERLALKEKSDKERIAFSLVRLATPLTGPAPDLYGEGEISDPLFAACEAVGRAAGITIKARPEILRKHRDPIAAIAKASGVRVRRVVLKGQWWKEDSGPMLAARDSDKQPMALVPRAAGHYEILDPVDRTRTRVSAENSQELSGFAYVFYRPFPAKRLTVRDLLDYGLADCHRDLWTVIIMGVLSGLLGMLTPIFTGKIFDDLIPGAQRLQLIQLGVILIACGITTAMFSLVRSFALLRIEGKMDFSVQAAVWDRLLSLPVPFFRDYTAGDLAARGMGIDQIRQTLTGSTLTSILSGVFSIFSFALLFYYSWRLALLATGLVLIAFLVSLTCGYIQVRQQRRLSTVRGRLSGAVLQFISGISKFRVSGTEGRAFAAWARDFTVQKEYSLRARKVQNVLTVFNAGFPVVATGAIFFYTAKLMSDPLVLTKLTTGQFLAFNAAFGQFLTAALQLSSSIISVLNIVPLYERAKPILQTLPEVDEGKSDPGELTGAIEVNHLAFRYREDTPLVLRDVSMSIAPGQFVAFVGSSGCGKSTLFRLLLGFEKPDSGSIYYDGQDLQSVDIQSVRRQIGVVLQNGRLLSGDIFTNIVGSAPLTVDDAWEAARMSGLDQDIRVMPMGMHTVIAEGGGGLSGGQRQRLMIARAIVGRPRILLFDEATSALDNQTQATVSKSLESLQATRIVIAHRLSTIINADKIFVLDKGVVVQAGNYETLISQKGLFAELAKRQLT
jgi:NHLM bacteriocin system ABC transporter ATP-binding protein